MAQIGELTDLATALTAIRGGKTKETTQTKLSEDAVAELARTLLSGEGGLAEIGSATRKSGLYDSTTMERLANDLLARTSAKVAVAGSPTERITEAPSTGVVPLLATLAGSQLLNAALKKGTSLISGVGSKAAAPIVEAVPSIARSSLSGASSAAGDVIAGTSAPAATTGVSSTLAGAGTAAPASGIGAALRANAIPGIGGLVSGILQGEEALEPENLLLTGGLPLLLGAGLPGALFALGGTALGAYGGDIFEGIGDIGKSIVDSVGDFFGDLF